MAFLPSANLAEINATFLAGIAMTTHPAAGCIHAYICSGGREFPWVGVYVARMWAYSVRVVEHRVSCCL